MYQQRFAQLHRDGWALFPAAVSNDLVGAARQAIEADLAHNYEPDRQREYDNISFCPDLRDQPPIAELLTHSSAKAILDRALGWDDIEYDRGQIAIRQAHNTDQAYPPKPHIDGISSGANGLAAGGISNFTALLGVFLTGVDTEFAGNFTVWPGSHSRLEAYFRDRGQPAMQEGMPQIELGGPVQLFANPGDVVLCHYQLAHAAAVNLSANDRIAVYFRVWLKGIEERRWELLTNIWTGWRS
jgi:Phytanoyl-CoA dioxygenase (PhyH)